MAGEDGLVVGSGGFELPAYCSAKKSKPDPNESKMDRQVKIAAGYFCQGELDDAARYLIDTYSRIIFRNFRMAQAKRDYLVQVTIDVAAAFYKQEKYSKVLELLSYLYQAELTGEVEIPDRLQDRLISLQMDKEDIDLITGSMNVPFYEMADYAAAAFCFEFSFSHKIGGKWEEETVDPNAPIIPNKDVTRSMFFVDAFVVALALSESSGDVFAYNQSSGTMGLMQLNQGTADTMAVQFLGFQPGDYNLWEAMDNIYLGTTYLRYVNKRLAMKLEGHGYTETDLLALSIMAYSADNGDASKRVMSYVNQIKAGEKINWFNGAFKAKYPTWWAHIVRTMGNFKAYTTHLYAS